MCAQQNKYYPSKTRSMLSLDPSQAFPVLVSTTSSSQPYHKEKGHAGSVTPIYIHFTVVAIKLMCLKIFIIQAI